jgi:hypothetical protein
MNIIKYGKLALLIAACWVNANADHKVDAPWSWHIVSAGLDESRISVHRHDQLLGIFNLSCDLTDLNEGPRIVNNASLNLVQIDSHPDGLLLITCNLGAHSQQVAIIDLAGKSNQPVFSKTGSYYADWEIQDGELWLRYDQPCGAGISVECPDGFETIFVQFPDPLTDQ